jgi:arginine exporter protein ArgO
MFRTGQTTRSPAQLIAAVFGVVFLIVGIAGFIPGLTTNYDTMQFAGHNSDALLLGVFKVSVLHNIVHLAFGIAGLAMARTANLARLFLLGGGIVYALLWLYGLAIDFDTAANFVPLNTADNWLHLVLAVAMVAMGLLPGSRRRSTGP